MVQRNIESPRIVPEMTSMLSNKSYYHRIKEAPFTAFAGRLQCGVRD
jgi:hypothetical protein